MHTHCSCSLSSKHNGMMGRRWLIVWFVSKQSQTCKPRSFRSQSANCLASGNNSGSSLLITVCAYHIIDATVIIAGSTIVRNKFRDQYMRIGAEHVIDESIIPTLGGIAGRNCFVSFCSAGTFALRSLNIFNDSVAFLTTLDASLMAR